MLSKLQNGQEKSKQTNFLLDLLLQGSLNKFAQNLQPPVDTKSTAPAATTNRSSIAGELHPHHSVYKDLM